MSTDPAARRARPRVRALVLVGSVLCVGLAGQATASATRSSPQVVVAGLDRGLVTTGRAEQKVVVSGRPGGSALVRAAVRRAGGSVRRDLPVVDGVSATVPADRLAALAAVVGVAAVTADRTARLTSSQWDDTVTSSAFAVTTGGTAAWAAGNRGQGVTVAVLDTGVSDVRDLAGRLLHGPDLSGEQAAATDSYGHGTVMAGLVAGDGSDSSASPRTGVAPAARVVSVKVAGANGATDVSTVLAAMQWVSVFASDAGIRVLNLSWGVASTQDPAVDPLDWTVEKLWRQGITVVVAAGNAGPTTGTVLKPADDPLVLTVGAYDDRGDTTTSNDVVPAWSSQGPTAQGLQKPDVVAPGRTVVATRAPGSTVEAQNPKALVPPSYIKGSGTSEATAVTSGVVALLLSAHPSWTPDQVKAALTSTAIPITGVAVTAQGRGRVSVPAALAADVAAVPAQTSRATGTGTLAASRGTATNVSTTCGGVTVALTGETTSWCQPWSSNNWTSNNWTSNNWTSNNWTGTDWTSNNWTGGVWSSNNWTSNNWTSNNWTSNNWTSADYGDTTFLTAMWGDHTRLGRPLPGETPEVQAPRCTRRSGSDLL